MQTSKLETLVKWIQENKRGGAFKNFSDNEVIREVLPAMYDNTILLYQMLHQ